MSGTWLRIAGAGLAVAAAALSYPTLFRRPCLTWGATPEEAARELPGDDLLADPDIISTRAVTIDAPPAAVWPWLVQMGSGRGGAYTYDWIENLFGLGMHSADEILPQFQDLKLGDELPLGPGRPTMRVEVFEPERALSLRFEDHNWVWTFALAPGRWPDQAAEQEPDRDTARVRAHPAGRPAGHGAGKPGDGAEDAAGDQGTGAAPGGRARPA